MNSLMIKIDLSDRERAGVSGEEKGTEESEKAPSIESITHLTAICSNEVYNVCRTY